MFAPLPRLAVGDPLAGAPAPHEKTPQPLVHSTVQARHTAPPQEPRAAPSNPPPFSRFSRTIRFRLAILWRSAPEKSPPATIPCRRQPAFALPLSTASKHWE